MCKLGIIFFCRFAPEADFGANAGLKVGRDLLDGIKKQFPWISYADLWTLAGVVAVEDMGGEPFACSDSSCKLGDKYAKQYLD